MFSRFRPQCVSVGWFVALCLTMSSCGDPTFEGEAVAVFNVPRTGAEPFFDLPWPSDLRVTPDGAIDMRDFPNPSIPILAQYLERLSTTVRGYSVSAPNYLRFGTAIDEDSLPPNPSASLENDASVFLINVDADTNTLENGTAPARVRLVQKDYESGEYGVLDAARAQIEFNDFSWDALMIEANAEPKTNRSYQPLSLIPISEPTRPY